MFTGREFEHIEHLIIYQILTHPLVSMLHCNMLNMLNVLTRSPVSIFPWRASFFLSEGLLGEPLFFEDFFSWKPETTPSIFP
jgi:hypothetical protein